MTTLTPRPSPASGRGEQFLSSSGRGEQFLPSPTPVGEGPGVRVASEDL